MAGFTVCSGRAIRPAGKKCIIVKVDTVPEHMEEHISENDELMIPTSQIHDDSEVYEVPGVGELIISEWLAIQKEWMEE